MPWEWVKPKKFMSAEETAGVAVYHCHKGGCLQKYHYQFRGDEYSSGWTAFDIRDLAASIKFEGLTEDRETHRDCIVQAVERDSLTAWLPDRYEEVDE